MELCLMASYPPGLLYPSENGAGRFFKEYQIGMNQDLPRLCSCNPSLGQAEESFKSLVGKLEENRLLKSHLEFRRPGHVDFQDFAAYSIHFGFGIAEQCTKHERAARFIFPGSSEKERHGVTLFELLKLVGPQVRTMTMHQQSLVSYSEECFHGMESQSSLLTPSREFRSREPLFVGDLDHVYHTHLPDGQLSFADLGKEVKDALLSLSEDFSSNKPNKMTKCATLVPYFDWRIRKGAKTNCAESSAKLEPAKSGEKVKNATSRKKNNMKIGKEKDLYRNSHLHACESLLSLMFNKRHGDRTAILSLKRSGSGITNLLTQFSVSIAGTGLAVLLSVVCKVTSAGVPFCTSKLVSTGLGLGLVWLSWAVNRLRDTVITINKNSGKFGIGEEELMCSLDQSVRDIYFRVATLLAVVVLRFA